MGSRAGRSEGEGGRRLRHLPPDPQMDLHPRSESWARLSVRRSLIGFIIAVALGVLLFLWVQWSHGRL